MSSKRNNTILITAIVALLSAAFAGLITYVLVSGNADKPTITVEGEAHLKETPDEYLVYFSVEEVGTEAAVLRQSVDEKGQAVITELIEMGVPEESFNNEIYIDDSCHYYVDECSSKDHMLASYQVNVSISDKDSAEKTYDKLLGDSRVGGTVSVQNDFSKEQKEELKKRATDEAIESAKTQGEERAKKLGKKLGDVVSVSEIFDSLQDGIFYNDAVERIEHEAAGDNVVQPSKLYRSSQELEFSINVTFELD